jgi:ferredoxin
LYTPAVPNHRCTILLHTTTGNTRLLARLAADRLRRAGHDCTIHDVVKHPAPPSLEDTELLVVACPTMYFRPTLVIERFLERLPRSATPRPAILLATAGGMPGAHFDILAERLREKGWICLAAHWVPFVNNWPPHRALSERIRLARPLLRAIDRRLPGLRWYLHWLWPGIGDPRAEDRDAFVRFIDRLARAWPTADLSTAPPPDRLCQASSASKWIGHRLGPREMRLATDVRIDPRRCTACGTCVGVCPVGCITRDHDRAVPRVGQGCTGCWACFQHCADHAISGVGSPAGAGRYLGPSAATRELFRAADDR